MARELDPQQSDEDLLPSEMICSRCGMSKEDWSGNKGKGVMEAGEIYCCRGCAEDTGCLCDTDRIEEETEETTTPQLGKSKRKG